MGNIAWTMRFPKGRGQSSVHLEWTTMTYVLWLMTSAACCRITSHYYQKLRRKTPMSRTRSISSIDTEIKKVEDELIKVQQKQEALEARLLELQKAKHEIESRQIMDAFHNSNKSLRELMIFLEG